MATANKTCSKCGNSKPVTEFSPSGNGYRAACKSCRRAGASTAKDAKAEKKAGAAKAGKGTHSTKHSKITPETDLNFELEKLLDPVQHNPLSLAQRKQKGAQWNPSLQMEGDEGTITTQPEAFTTARDFSWDDLLRNYGLNPEEYEIIEPVSMNQWDAQTPLGIERMMQYKARVRRRTISGNRDVDDLLTVIDKWKPSKKTSKKPSKKAFTGDDGVFNVVIADWQAGGNEGMGSEALVGRVLHAIEAVKERVAELRLLGRPLGALQVICVGDLIENCDGFYSQQTFSVDLDMRDQIKVCRRLLMRALMEWSELFDDVRVVAVGGNHGENRSSGGSGGGGRSFTSFNDNQDTAIVESIAEAFALNPDKFGHVRFFVPREQLYITVETCGWNFAVTHGHLARRSGTAEAKLHGWFNSMAGGGLLVDVHLLVTGHFHSLKVSTWSQQTTWIQAPSLDNGSRWFTDSTGVSSDPGLLTFLTTPEEKFADMQALAVPPHLRNDVSGLTQHQMLAHSGRPGYMY